MLQFFRNFFKSKVGIVVTLAFLALIALAFASMDVANTGSFGGVAGGDRVAMVGDRRIDTSDLQANVTNGFEQARQSNPTLTMESFIAGGGLQRTLETMLSRAALAELATSSGLRAGARLVDSEIVAMPDFRALDGSFDQQAFRNAVRQRGLSEELVRSDLAMGLLANQLIGPLTASPQIPTSLAQLYTRLRLETRNGSILALPAVLFAPQGDPTAAQLQAFYDENRARYIRPERRIIRYAVFGEEAVGDLPEPSQAQIAERYQENIDQYRALETRAFTQVVVPTQAAAQAIVDEVDAGQSLQASAQAKGLGTAALESVSREQLASNASPAVAQAGFAAASGGIAAPAQGPLGWYVLRVDEVERRPERSLADARPEIVEQLTTELRRQAINDMTVRIEDEFARGRNLSEVAGEIGVELQASPPLTAAGQVYGTPQQAPELLSQIIPVAFELNRAQPQLDEVVPGQTFIVYDVADITRSATAPLAEIRDDVSTAWRVDAGMRAAGQAAARVVERVEGGASLAEASAAEEADLPAPQPASLTRQQVEQAGQMTAALALFFSMAEGTVKHLENQGALSWLVIELDEIDAPEVDRGDPQVAVTREQLRTLLPDEYTEQLIAAAQDLVEIEVNQAAVDAVAAQLTGQAN